MELPTFKPKNYKGNFYKDKTIVNEAIYRLMLAEKSFNITDAYLEWSRTYQVSEAAIRKLINQYLPKFSKARIEDDWVVFIKEPVKGGKK